MSARDSRRTRRRRRRRRRRAGGDKKKNLNARPGRRGPEEYFYFEESTSALAVPLPVAIFYSYAFV